MRPSFDSPIIVIVGFICTWLAIGLPFAFICRQMARPDAMSEVESFLTGLACGPVGIWVVRRLNERARIAAHETGKLMDARRTAPDPEDAPPPPPHLMPGGNAYMPPPERSEWLRDKPE